MIGTQVLIFLLGQNALDLEQLRLRESLLYAKNGRKECTKHNCVFQKFS